jgi:Tfp pilus assembly protein PilN
VSRARKKFAELPNFDVHVLEPVDLDMPWQHAAEVPGTDLAAALGTAMVLYSDSTEQQGPNLIERALALHREPLRPILIRSAIPVAAVILIAASLFLFHLKQWRETASLHAELESLAPACTHATELRLNLGAAEHKLGELQALQKQLPQPNWQQIFTHISQSMPADVWLDRLSVRDGLTASLAGASYSDEGVYSFVGYLKQVPDVAETALDGTGVGQNDTGHTTTFTLQLTLANVAGRSEKESRHD